MKKKILLVCTASICLISFFSACSKRNVSAEGKGPQSAKKLTIGIYHDAGGVTIWSGGAFSPWVLDAVCDRLTGPNAHGSDPVPLLAEYVKPVSQDNRVWEIKLKAGIKWHDGTPLTSADVKFTFDYNRDGPSNNRYSHHFSQMPRFPAEGISVIDELTLRVSAAVPCPFFDREPCAETPIIQKAQWENLKDPRQFAGKSIGTGPYVLKDFVRGEYYTLVANKDYFLGKPLVDELHLVVIRDPTTMFTALKSGEIDGAARSLPVELVSEWKNDKRLGMYQTPNMWAACITVDNKNLPFGNLETRRALSLSIDRDELLNTIALGQGLSGELGYAHPLSYWANKSKKKQQPYNRESAQELYSKLGYVDKDGDGFRENTDGSFLDWRIIVDSSQPLYIRTGEIITEQLKKVGIRSHVEAVETATFSQITAVQGNYNMSIGEFVPHGMADDDMMVVLLYGEKKTDFMPNPQRDQDLKTWENAATREGRLAASHALQSQMNEYPRRIMLWFPYGFFAYNKTVYDNYSVMMGYNIFHKFSFLPNDVRKGFVMENFTQDELK